MDTEALKSGRGSWTGNRHFVGRADLFAELQRQVEATVTDHGRAVFLLGADGAGKTACLAIFQELAFRAHRSLRAEYVDCTQSGTKTWLELAEIFTRGHRLKRSAKLIVIDWLESIPIVGKIAQAVVRTIVAIRTGEVEPGKLRRGSARSPGESALMAVRMLLEIEPREPRLIIMDSFDRGDTEDLAGASALIRHLGETRTLFVAAVRTVDGRSPPPVEDLMLEAERLTLARRLVLPPLSAAEIRAAVEESTRSSPSEDWLEWLDTQSGGNPGALWSILGSLEESGAVSKSGRTWTWSDPPPSVAMANEAAGPTRQWELSEEDRRLVATAACVGQVFDSALVANLVGMSELAVEDRLAMLCRAGLIEFRDTTESGDEMTSRYAFRHGRDAHYFTGTLPVEERDRLVERLSQIRMRRDV